MKTLEEIFLDAEKIDVAINVLQNIKENLDDLKFLVSSILVMLFLALLVKVVGMATPKRRR